VIFRQRWVLVAVVAALLTVVAAAVFVLTVGDGRTGWATSAGRAADTVVAGRVTDDGLRLEHPRGALLDIPADALPVGTEVRLALNRPDELDRLGPLQPDGTAWAIDASVQPSRPVSFTMPYTAAKLPPDARPLAVTFDELAGLWLPVETTVDTAGGRLTATLPSFSVKTWIADRIADASGPASWLEYQTWKVFGNRAEKPGCGADAPPGWVSQFITVPDDNAQLFACLGATTNGFYLNVANNRGFPVALELDEPFTAASPSRWEDGLSGIAAELFARTGNRRLLLMPTGSARIEYDPVATENGSIEGHVRRDSTALLMYLAVELAREAGADLKLANGKQLGLWTLECFGRMFSATGQVLTGDPVAAANQMTSCLEDTLTHEVRLWGFDPDEQSGQRLWSHDADRLPPDARRAVKALRVLRALDVAKWTQTAADLFIVDNNPAADLVDVAVHWRGAPKWGAGAEGGIHLYRFPAVVDGAAGESGRHTSTEIAGRAYPQSTGAWVGCGQPATLAYRIEGDYRRLKGTVGLAPHTPGGLTVRVTVTADGRELAVRDVTPARPAPIDLDVSTVRDLRFAVVRVGGECGTSSTAYGVLGDAYLVGDASTPMPELPAGYVGTWTGRMTQPGSPQSPYSMTVVVRAGATNAQIGTVSYPALGCSGTWTLRRAQRSRVEVVEHITVNGQCVVDVPLEIRPTADGRLYVAGAGDSAPTVWATLTRTG
jgi:hypothetical protein